MNEQAKRIQEIMASMDGPDRGKKARLAALAGCTRALVGQWMTVPGQTINYDHARSIELTLGYRIDWIINGQLPKHRKDAPLAAQPSQPPAATELAIDEIVKLLSLYGQLTDESRRMVREFCDQMPKRSADQNPIVKQQ